MNDPLRPSYGEIWRIDFDPTQGHEQAGVRPGLVISNDAFNHGPARMVIVLPITTRFRNIPIHVRVDPPEGGLPAVSYVKCEDVRAVSTGRLKRRHGVVSAKIMEEVADSLRILLNL